MSKINILIGKNIINSNTITEQSNEVAMTQKEQEGFLKKLVNFFKNIVRKKKD